MGCDIHVHVEVKIRGEWMHLSAIEMSRNYALFARMADVRNYGDVTPMAPARGLPDDTTFLTKFDSDRWSTDAHSHSHLSAAEMADLSDWWAEFCKAEGISGSWFEDRFGWIFNSSWSGFTRYPEDRPRGVEDARCVFWFDN